MSLLKKFSLYMPVLNLIRFVFASLLISFSAFAMEIITIATGSTSGLYYPSGGAICRIFNLSSKNEKKCIVESTPGSEYNLNAVEGGLNNFAFVQADELFTYLAEKKKRSEISSISTVFPLYTETFLLIASKNSGITNFSEIKGKKINIGIDGSGVRNFTSQIMKFLALKTSDFKVITETQSAVEHSLCNNIADASIVIGGQPNKTVQNLIEQCGARIIPFSPEFIQLTMEQNAFYSLATIPTGMYLGYSQPVQTLGTKALLVTSKYTSEENVFDITNYIIKNFDSFKQYSPVIMQNTVQTINPNMLQFPVNNASSKAFKENEIN